MKFTDLVEEAKTKNSLSQGALARRLDVNESNFSRMLRGRRPIPAEIVIEMYDLLGMKYHPKVILKAARELMTKASTVTLFVTGCALLPAIAQEARAAGVCIMLTTASTVHRCLTPLHDTPLAIKILHTHGPD